MKFYFILCAFSAACILPAQALPPSGEAAFLKSLSNIRGALTLPRLQMPSIKPEKVSAPLSGKEGISAQLDEWLGIFHQLELQPAMGLAAMSAEVVGGLNSGAYNGVILGESHGTQPEIAAGLKIIKDILAARGIGAFSREKEIFPTIDFLEAQGVPVLTMKNQFKPEPDVLAGLKAAGGKLLVTYTGHAHTAIRLKDYFLFTLMEGKTWGYVPGGKDMITVENVFLNEQKKPVIVAMMTEARVLRRIEQLFLRKFIGEAGSSCEDYLGNLRSLKTLWDSKILQYPAHAEDIYFVRSPQQANLFVGITPGDRRPVAVDAVLQALSLPEFAAWLGADMIKIVESLWSSDETGVSYRVVARKFSGEIFERTIRP